MNDKNRDIMSNSGFLSAMLTALLFAIASGSIQAAEENDKQEDPYQIKPQEGPLKTVAELKEFNRQGKRRFWGNAETLALIQPKGKVLFKDNFKNLDQWHHEGSGELTLPEKDTMQINCIGSRQGAQGCMAFCRQDFPDDICLEYDMQVLTQKGLIITFIGTRGRQGEDIITELPPRKGTFGDYISNPDLRCYHVSVSAFHDDGRHRGTAHWRRNPGAFLMAGGPDPCGEKDKWYHVTIIKRGRLIQLGVDGKLVVGFIDPDAIPDAIPTGGKVGYRTIGADVQVQIRNFQVKALE